MSLAHYGESFLRGMQIATAPANGPVLLVCDTDLQEADIADRAALPAGRVTPVAPPGANPAAIDRVADC